MRAIGNRMARLFMLFLLLPYLSPAQKEVPFEEIYVFFNVPLLGGTDIPAIIHGQELYLPVVVVFDFLKIRNVSTTGFDSVSGYLLNQDLPFSIDRLTKQVKFCRILYQLKPDDLIRNETNLFLKMDNFGKIFGLECSFDFWSLTVSLNTKLELPFIREMRQEQMRNSISRMKGNQTADTTIKRSYSLFHFGMADWSMITQQQTSGQSNIRLNLTLGSVIAGGAANVTLNYSSNEPFSEKQQQYLWHFVNNDFKGIRQVMAGKISTPTIATMHGPFVGIALTNTPTQFRRSFCTYTLTDYTEPGWIVELYVNYILVDYLKADASGFFKFEVPLVYGTSQVMLRFYGPWGEERSKKQFITVPYNFLPPGKLEYAVYAGMVEDSVNSRFGRAIVNYGLNRLFSIGGGAEYLTSVKSGKLMPFLTFSWRLARTLLLSAEYTQGVRARGILSYRLPKDLLIELNYIKYAPGQNAINTNFLEERKAMISMPLRSNFYSAFVRFSLNQTVMPLMQNTTAEFLVSGIIGGVSTSISNYMLYSNRILPMAYSTVSLGFRLPGNLNVIPQAQYEYTHGRFVSAKIEIEKRVFTKGMLTLSYENNFSYGITNVMAGFRYDFSFGQTSVYALASNDNFTFNQSARGTIITDQKSNYFSAGNRSSVGRGGIAIVPYVDVNNNNKRDFNEQKAFGLNININGGSIEQRKQDTTLFIIDLEPYTNYMMEIDQSGFENVAWKIMKRTINVTVEPNQFKLIEIPVVIAGEVSGFVYYSDHAEKKGIGRIHVCIYDLNSHRVASMLTEPDGFFSYLGLAPGSYKATVDKAQLKKLNYVSTPDAIFFNIETNIDGDVSSGHEFVLNSLLPGKTEEN